MINISVRSLALTFLYVFTRLPLMDVWTYITPQKSLNTSKI